MYRRECGDALISFAADQACPPCFWLKGRNGGRVFQPAFPLRWAIKSFRDWGQRQVKPEALGPFAFPQELSGIS